MKQTTLLDYFPVRKSEFLSSKFKRKRSETFYAELHTLKTMKIIDSSSNFSKSLNNDNTNRMNFYHNQNELAIRKLNIPRFEINELSKSTIRIKNNLTKSSFGCLNKEVD